MTIRQILAELRFQVIEIVTDLIRFIARIFGYPNNPGMPIIEEGRSPEAKLIADLPTYQPKNWPPVQHPENIWQVIFGSRPHTIPVEKFIYESDQEGYYNFYILDYKNLYYLPDWLSELIQIHLNVCLDTTVLEMARETLFLALVLYSQMLSLRVALFWCLTINPYTRPWVYFIAMTDWAQEIFMGLVPAVFGVDLLPTVFAGIIGKFADSLNYLVFTMPFLPSEGQKTQVELNPGDVDRTNILVFHYLPSLWYKYPIPDDIREFWYTERPDIFEFMEKNYKHLEIEFVPNRILKEVYERQHSLHSLTDNSFMIKDISTQILSDSAAYVHQSVNFITHSQEQLFHFLTTHIDKLIF